MMTGDEPLAGMQMHQIMMAVAVQYRVPAVPDSAPAASFLRRCFAKDPRERPSAGELAAALAPPSPAAAHNAVSQLEQRSEEMQVRIEELESEVERLKGELQEQQQLVLALTSALDLREPQTSVPQGLGFRV